MGSTTLLEASLCASHVAEGSSLRDIYQSVSKDLLPQIVLPSLSRRVDILSKYVPGSLDSATFSILPCFRIFYYASWIGYS